MTSSPSRCWWCWRSRRSATSSSTSRRSCFGRSYYQVKAVFANAAAVDLRSGAVGHDRRRRGRPDRRRAARARPGRRDDGHLQEVRADLPQRDRAAAPADAAQGHVPGARSAARPAPAAVPAGGTLGIASTQPDIDVDQILGSLDADTRTYLLLLLSGGAQAFNGKGATASRPSAATAATLAADFKRFAPVDRSTLNFTKLLSQRSSSLKQRDPQPRSGGELARRRRHAAGVAGRGVEHRLHARSPRRTSSSQQGIALLPGALKQTSSTLGKVQQFAAASGPALKQLEPFARDLGPALEALRPLAKDTTPVIENQLEPFASNPGDPQARADAGAGRGVAGQGRAGALQLVRGAQQARQHARLPAARRRAELPLLGRLARPQPRQPHDACRTLTGR